jgi:hypothetical protein
MCQPSRRAIVDAMPSTSITIVLELDETTDVPAGSARLPGGPSREFHGWLGLTEAIDSLSRSPRPNRHSSSVDEESQSR